MSRRLGVDLALVTVTVSSAAVITFPAGHGFAEFTFVVILLGLLVVGLRQAGQTWWTASRQRRRAALLASASPTEAALQAADEESERMLADIRSTLRQAVDGIAAAVQRAQASVPGDSSGLAHVAAIQRQGLVATTELRRMLGLLRSPAAAPRPSGPPPQVPRVRWRTTGRVVLAGLMLTEIIVTALFWGDGNGVLPETGPAQLGLQVALCLLVVALYSAPLGAAMACLCTAAVLVLGQVLGLPILDGLWRGFIMALLAWRVITRSNRGWDHAALAALCVANGVTIWISSPGNLPIHVVMMGGAIITAAMATIGDQLRTTAQARADVSEQLVAEETERAIRHRRLQVARELHDALSGTVGVIVAQAGAAEVQWLTRPERARTALHVVADAVAHARRDLDLMVPVGPGEDHQPGLADIPALVERMRAAGIVVRLTQLPEGLSGATGAAAYRIVQECLANVARHAPGATATVSVAIDEGCLQVTVADDGPGLTANDAGGYGLTGLRERTSLLGGTLALDSGDGLRVVARVPAAPSAHRSQGVR